MLAHNNDVVSENPSLVLSISSSDDLVEGVRNQFFTKENFDTAFLSKSVDDLQASSSKRTGSESRSKAALSQSAVSAQRRRKRAPRSAGTPLDPFLNNGTPRSGIPTTRTMEPPDLGPHHQNNGKTRPPFEENNVATQ